MVIGKLILFWDPTGLNINSNINNKKDLRVKKHQQMSCKSCINSTNVVSPSTNIAGSTCNATNVNIIPNNSIISMNEENKKVMLIASEKGIDEAVKHMFNPTGEKQLSYAEMRERYG